MQIIIAVTLALLGLLSLMSLDVITGGKIIEGVFRGYQSVGAPTAGVNEVQTLTIGGTPTAGSFTLTYDGFTTTAIPWAAVNATLLASINAALLALPNTGAAGIVATAGTLTAGIGTILLTFGGNLAASAVNTITVVSSLTGTAPTLANVETTAGVTASGRGAPKGAQLVDTTNGIAYINTGTALVPVWTKTGTQT